MVNRIFMPRWIILLIVVAITAVTAVLFLFPDIAWVGWTDLEVEFVITDAAGQAVPDARIEIQSDGGLYEENSRQEFSLTTDGKGSVSKVCRNSMCAGRRNNLFGTDTFAVHLPWWRFRVVKEGFEVTHWIDLNVSHYTKLTRRIEPGKSKLIVPISLDPIPRK